MGRKVELYGRKYFIQSFVTSSKLQKCNKKFFLHLSAPLLLRCKTFIEIPQKRRRNEQSLWKFILFILNCCYEYQPCVDVEKYYSSTSSSYDCVLSTLEHATNFKWSTIIMWNDSNFKRLMTFGAFGGKFASRILFWWRYR